MQTRASSRKVFIAATGWHQLLVTSVSTAAPVRQILQASTGSIATHHQVVRVKHEQRDGVTALVLGAGFKKAKSLNGREAGEFHAAGVPLKAKLWECRVSDDALLPVGTPLGARHFVAGQFVDVCGRTKDKGFQGVMKRHGFKGQGASHGNTKSHRRPGAIGGRTDPGKVWKGKKMPGCTRWGPGHWMRGEAAQQHMAARAGVEAFL